MDSEGKPWALFVYYSYTHQTEKVLDTIALVLQERGWEVTFAAIDFTDPRYRAFPKFPMPKPLCRSSP